MSSAAPTGLKRFVLTRIGWHTAATAVTFAEGILLARLLGPEGKGAVTLAAWAPSLALTIGQLGIRNACAVMAGKRAGSGEDPAHLAGVLVWLWLWASVLTLGLTGLLAWTTEGVDLTAGLLAAIPVPCGLMSRYAAGLAIGTGRFQSTQINEAVGAGSLLLGTAALVFAADLGVYGALTSRAVSALIAAGFAWSWLAAHGPPRPRRDLPLAHKLVVGGILYAVLMTVLQLCYRADLWLVARWRGTLEAGLYAQGVSVAELSWQVSAALGFAVFAHRAASPHDKTHAVQARRTALKLLPWAVLGAASLCVAAPVLIPLVFGRDFAQSVPVVWLLAPGIAAFVPFKVLFGDLAGRGILQPLLVTTVGGLTLMVGLDVVLIPAMGIEGAAIGSSVAYTAMAAGLAWLHRVREPAP